MGEEEEEEVGQSNYFNKVNDSQNYLLKDSERLDSGF